MDEPSNIDNTDDAQAANLDPANGHNDTAHSAPSRAGGGNNDPISEAHLRGVAVHLPDDNAEDIGFDVIGIHGIHGQSRETWRVQPPSSPIKTWLASGFSGATSKPGRVILYGYDSNEYTGTCYTLRGVYQEAQALLDKLVELRTSAVSEARRPIYWVSHDIGGLLVKAALVLATESAGKYGDILNSTRAMIFFGYPHRPLTSADLEEQITRLLSLRKDQYHPGHMARLVKSLVDTITEVNGAFIHTRMPIQAILVNVFSTRADAMQRVFNEFTATWGSPFERRLKCDKPHLELAAGGEDGAAAPLGKSPDLNWLAGDLPNTLFRSLGELLRQAPPIYPSLEAQSVTENAELDDLIKTNSDRILHIRCPSDSSTASEMVRQYLDTKREKSQLLLYFRFRAHDIRFNRMQTMLETFLSQMTYNQLQVVTAGHSRVMAEYYEKTKEWAPDDMYFYWETLRTYRNAPVGLYLLGCLDQCDESAFWFLSRIRRIVMTTQSRLRIVIVTTKGTAYDQLIADDLTKFPRDIVTCVDYAPPCPILVQSGFEVSMLLQEDPRYATDGLRHEVAALISACSNDKDLCRLLIEWLKSTRDPAQSVSRLRSRQSEKLDPGVVFEAVLGEIPIERQKWAQQLLSWMLLSFRPLRTSEFHRVSDLCLRMEKEAGEILSTVQPTVRQSLSSILQYFVGMLAVIDGEVRFGHPSIHGWLEGEMDAKEFEEDRVKPISSKKWYHKAATQSRQIDILQTCLEHLQDDGDPPEIWAAQLPYAIQFWVRHYKLAGPVDGALEAVFEPRRTFRRWISAYTPSLGQENWELLPVAAHFGLEDMIRSLLAKTGDNSDACTRGQALVEAARAGELSAVLLILKSYPSGLDFDDAYLHEAVTAASINGNPKLFWELVSRIPKSRHDISSYATSGEEKDEYKQKKAADDNRAPDDESDGGVCSNKGTKQSTALEEANDPFLWLTRLLYRACWLGEDKSVTKLLSLGANPNPPKGLLSRGRTPLHAAALAGHSHIAELLLSAGASVAAPTEMAKSTPLHYAADFGTPAVTELLLNRGASVNATDDNGFTPLYIACQQGNFALVKTMLRHKSFQGYSAPDPRAASLLWGAVWGGYRVLETCLGHGVDPNIPDPSGNTPLWQAVVNHRTDLCRLLLDNKADPDLAPDGATPPLIQAVRVAKLEIVSLLIDHGADIEKKEGRSGGWERTPLNVAASLGQPDIVGYLVSKGANPDAPDGDGWTPIWSAARSGHTEVVRILAEAKADVNSACGNPGWTPLHAASEFPETVGALLECGADINKAPGGPTPLNYAIRMNFPKTIQVMLRKSRRKPDITLDSTHMALRGAVLQGHTEVVSLILEAGADVNRTSDGNVSLLSSAVMFGGDDLVRTILEYRPDIYAKGPRGGTAMHRITGRTSVASLRLLVHAGADVNALDKRRQTPLIRAVLVGNGEAVKYLLTLEGVASTLNMALFRASGTPLHAACRRGTLEMVQLLIECGSDTNFGCTELDGSPLIAATLRPDKESEKEKRQIIQLLLDNGADPAVPAGILGYPILSASLACSAELVKFFLSRGVSTDIQDPLGRKPIHLACLNSREVVGLLDVPDSDFAACDVIGRVPLHYAVLSGQTDLVEEVLSRSQRVGIDVNVQDKDGWTPLLWAARAPSIYPWGWRRAPSHDEVVALLLRRGASATISAHGLIKDWTPVETAYYHNADSIAELIAAHDSSAKESSGPRKRGQLADGISCDCCLVVITGVYFHCAVCGDIDLCFKCYKSKSAIHPHHEFDDVGYEWDSDDTASEKAGSEDGSGLGSEHAEPVIEFDDEIVGEDEPETEEAPVAGSGTPSV